MKTQAWGWLAAAVLAAGLNASYHDGGLEWAHRIADRMDHGASAVMALASGRADQFLAEMRMASTHDEAPSCRFATSFARVQTKLARTETRFAHFEGMTARQEAQLARLEANRDDIMSRIDSRNQPHPHSCRGFQPSGCESAPSFGLPSDSRKRPGDADDPRADS